MFKEKFQKVKKFFKERTLDALVAIFLGIATLLVAWVGWIRTLHEGNQAANYTTSNNLMTESNAAYNVAAQVYISDLFTWNSLLNLQLDKDAAVAKGDAGEVQVINNKIEKIKRYSCSPKLLEVIDKKEFQEGGSSPFENEEFTNIYFEESQRLLEESQKAMADGEQDNLWSDSYELVSVLYALVLFLLGIVGVIKEHQTRKMLFIFSVCILAVAVIYMLTLPMPRDFDFGSFFNFG